MITLQIKGREPVVMKALERLKKYMHEKQAVVTPVKPSGTVLAEVEYHFRIEMKELRHLTQELSEIQEAVAGMQQLQGILNELEQSGLLEIRVLTKALEDYITLQDAETAYGFPQNTLLVAIKRDGKFNNEIKRGLVKQKGRQWLIHKEALYEKYGQPKNEV